MKNSELYFKKVEGDLKVAGIEVRNEDGSYRAKSNVIDELLALWS